MIIPRYPLLSTDTIGIVKRKEVIQIAESNGNGRGSSNRNGKQSQPESSIKYEHLASDTWAKEEDDEVSLTDTQAIREELEEDKDSQADDRN